MVVFSPVICSNPTSKIAIGYFYVFSLAEINNSHNIFRHLFMSWLILMLSSFPHVYPKVNLLKVTVSEYFLSQP